MIVGEQGRSSSWESHVYIIQAPNGDIVNRTRHAIGSKLIRESIIMRKSELLCLCIPVKCCTDTQIPWVIVVSQCSE